MSATNRLTRSLAFAMLAASILGASSASCLGQVAPGDRVPHRFVVRLAPGQTLNEMLALHNASLVRSQPNNWYLIQSSSEVPDDDCEHDLGSDRGLDRVEQDRVNGITEGTTQSFFPGHTPDEYAFQVSVDRLGITTAHLTSTGVGVVVAVLDTGVSPHIAFASRLRTDGFNFITNSSDTSDSIVGPKTGHGTLMAGIIAAVAPDAEILPVTVLDPDGLGTSFTLAQGVRYAVEHGATVINLSLYSTVNSSAVEDAINEAINEGVVVVAAMANNNRYAANTWPAAIPRVLAVAAVDDNDRRAAFSDYAPFVDLCAPGVNISSTYSDDQYATGNGTSFSASFVSGAAALVQARSPRPSPTLVRTFLWDSAVNVDPLNVGDPQHPASYYQRIGRRIDIGAAVLFRCVADVDDGSGTGTRDGGVGIEDLFYYLGLFTDGSLDADIDDGDGLGVQDGGVGIEDLLYYLMRFEHGC